MTGAQAVGRLTLSSSSCTKRPHKFFVGLFSVKEKSGGNEPVPMKFLLKTQEHWEILKQFPLFQVGNQRKQVEVLPWCSALLLWEHLNEPN